MANPNPDAARAAKRAKRRQQAERAGTVEDLRLKVWRALDAADGVLGDAKSDPVLKLRALHALTQASSAYLKLVEVSELDARMRRIEERLDRGAVF